MNKVNVETNPVKRHIMRSDKGILDWLQNECGGSFSCKRQRDPFVASPTFGNLDEWQIFTIPSQHVKGVSIRDAFSNAMNKCGA